MIMWIELTDRNHQRISVNFGNVDYFVEDGDETELYINNTKFPLYVNESYSEVKELLVEAIENS
ncbi:hypothetical protein [Virgibacillus halodenitrificans]|uniref:Uncharacterized protein n=1 Tax=Virgibacillus halodenitrificans TaxID=1482 RepID=A0ABR7VNP5_VIRHA|nr:hypothetical protein [Virgibacillus halodenitrificans]MBD1223268.1 hypothetical protein [Virgibacillus halodenitrificans]